MFSFVKDLDYWGERGVRKCPRWRQPVLYFCLKLDDADREAIGQSAARPAVNAESNADWMPLHSVASESFR